MHTHVIEDRDKHFVIDAVTRKIVPETPEKNKLVQNDHNSEKLTFEIPKTIEGHDMSLCDIVEIHYLNISSDKSKRQPGIVTVADFGTLSGDPQKCAFTWTIDRNCTKYEGILSFAIRFACSGKDSPEYEWYTLQHSGITISSTLFNGPVIVEQYVDILQKWYNDLVAAKPEVTLNETVEGVNIQVKTGTNVQNAMVRHAKGGVIDNTLTVPNQPAEAKTVGDKISEINRKTAELSDGLNQRVLINQGVENNGKILGVGADGNLSPIVSGNNEVLIYRYTHNNNIVLRPTHLDLSTGVFTCNNHGLKNNDILVIILEDCYHHIPYEILNEKYISTSNMRVEVVDVNSFKLKNQSGQAMTFPSSDNTHIDVTKFKFEKVNDIKEFKFDGFNEKNLHIRLYGGIAYGCDSHSLRVNFINNENTDIGYLNHKYAYGIGLFNSNGIGKQFNNRGLVTYVLSDIVLNSGICVVNTSCEYFNVSVANYNYSKQYPKLVGNRYPMVVWNEFDKLENYTNITGVKFNASTASIIFANGFTIDIYALR